MTHAYKSTDFFVFLPLVVHPFSGPLAGLEMQIKHNFGNSWCPLAVLCNTINFVSRL